MFIQEVLVRSEPGFAAAAVQLAEVRDGWASATGHEVSAWRVLAGAPAGTLRLSSTLGGYGDLAASVCALEVALRPPVSVRPAVLAPIGGLGLERIIATTGPDASHHAASETQVSVVGGRSMVASAWGIDALEHIGSLTGVRGLVTRSVTGPLDRLAWRLAAPCMESIEAMEERLDADPTWSEMLESAAESFIALSWRRLLLERV